MSEVPNQPPIIPRERIQISHAKRLRGGPYKLAEEMIEKRDGPGNKCEHVGGRTIDHGDPRIFRCYCGELHQDHSLENLSFLCHDCNSGKGGPKKKPEPSNDLDKEREKKAGTGIHTSTISQREHLSQSEKHARERALWDEWLPDFFFGMVDTANRKLGVPLGHGIARISVDDLADLAVSELGIRAGVSRYGSAQTFKKYIYEDRFTVLFLEVVEGIPCASWRRDDQRGSHEGTLLTDPKGAALKRLEQAGRELMGKK